MANRGCSISEYTIVQCEYADVDCIKAALEELGYVFEEHSVAQRLRGWRGELRQQDANIIIRQQNVGRSSNDVGFRKKSNGKYELIISEYDLRAGETKTKLMSRMKPLYAKHRHLKSLKRLRTKVTSIKAMEDGRIKIKARIQ